MTHYLNRNEKLESILSDTKPMFWNEKKRGKHILTLSGKVGSYDAEGYFSANDVREALDGVKEDIVIKINSVGGEVFEGIEIYNYIQSLSNHVTVEVTALAASAASVIAMGANEVIMNPGSQMMIHRASGVCIGNHSAMEEVAKILINVDKSLISIYEQKTENTHVQLKKWLNEEKWFTAEEAVKHNFADKIDKVVIENNISNKFNRNKFNRPIANKGSNKTAFEKFIMRKGV